MRFYFVLSRSLFYQEKYMYIDKSESEMGKNESKRGENREHKRKEINSKIYSGLHESHLSAAFSLKKVVSGLVLICVAFSSYFLCGCLSVHVRTYMYFEEE